MAPQRGDIDRLIVKLKKKLSSGVLKEDDPDFIAVTNLINSFVETDPAMTEKIREVVAIKKSINKLN